MFLVDEGVSRVLRDEIGAVVEKKSGYTELIDRYELPLLPMHRSAPLLSLAPPHLYDLTSSPSLALRSV